MWKFLNVAVATGKLVFVSIKIRKIVLNYNNTIPKMICKL
jgi:hypothetical protein